jgi:lactoylglutathione lyase
MSAVCPVLRYAQLGIAVTNLQQSQVFYQLLGFQTISNSLPNVLIMKNAGGLELQLLQSTLTEQSSRNILMDYDDQKYPGHTHAALSVPNIQSTREYFESNGLVISGERNFGDKIMSIFVRDNDRTTFEFEVHEEEVSGPVAAENIGAKQSLDHVGLRITQPEMRWNWYAEKFGFVHEIMKYELNEDPLKNRRPWISRTESGVDMNFILNTNMSITENILLQSGSLLPGIVFVGFSVENLERCAENLIASGVSSVTRDAELGSSSTELRYLADKIATSEKSVFLLDEDRNIIRLLERREEI